MELIELKTIPSDWKDYRGKFVKIEGDTFGVYFVRSDNSCDYISNELFDIIKTSMTHISTNNKPVDNDYLKTLVALSGKYTSDDIIKFKREGMI
jgi:hypothetical protein